MSGRRRLWLPLASVLTSVVRLASVVRIASVLAHRLVVLLRRRCRRLALLRLWLPT